MWSHKVYIIKFWLIYAVGKMESSYSRLWNVNTRNSRGWGSEEGVLTGKKSATKNLLENCYNYPTYFLLLFYFSLFYMMRIQMSLNEEVKTHMDDYPLIRNWNIVIIIVFVKLILVPTQYIYWRKLIIDTTDNRMSSLGCEPGIKESQIGWKTDGWFPYINLGNIPSRAHFLGWVTPMIHFLHGTRAGTILIIVYLWWVPRFNCSSPKSDEKEMAVSLYRLE